MMTRLLPLALSFAALAFSGSLLAQAPNISVTKSDGTPAATKKNPGDTVTYTNTITNSGIGAATGVNFTDPDVVGSAVQNGTLKVSPIAFDDAYTGIIASGVGINTNTATEFSATANDYVGVFNNNPGTITIVAFDATSANGGTVTMVTSGADMGKFTYVSAAGYTGPDSFTYTISNTGFTATGTVSLTVSGPGMFFVSTTGNDTTGNGTLAAPYATLTKVATVDANTSQRIFVFTGAYAAGMTMEANEQIIGQGVVGASYDAVVTGVTPGADSAPRPTINGAKPTITAAAGNVLTLADNNVIRGVTINSTVAGFAVAGNAIPSFQLGSTSAGLPASDTLVNSSGTSSGCLSLTGAATGTVNVTGQLTATVGRSLLVTGRTGGTTSIIGKVTDNNLGVSLDSNTGTTFNFRCLNLSTGANTAFSATGGGTVNATNGVSDAIDNDGDGTTDEADEANTIVTGTGTALNVANTTIGASGLTFRSINSSSASSSSGIVLNTTGTTGGLTVTGTGSAGSGGTISNKTVTGISLTSTANLNLSSMTITGNGDAIDENGIRASNLFGTCALTGVTASFNFHANVHIRNASGATPLTLTVSGCTFNNSSTHDGFDFFADPSGVASPLGGNMTLSVLNSTFNSNFSDGLFGGVTSNTTTGPGFCFITATTSTFNSNGANGLAIVSAGSGDTKFNVFSNVSISGNPSFGVNLFQNNASTSAAKLRGVVNNNTITYSTSGGGGACLLLNTQGAGSGTVEITNNILNYNDGGNTGMTIQSGDGASPGVLHVKTTGNTINVTGANPLRGMLVESGITSASTRTVNWHPGVAGASDDTVITRDGAAAAVPRIIVRKRVNSFFNIHNLSPSPSTTVGQVQAHLSSVMGITPSTDITVSSTGSYQVNYAAVVVDTSAATGAPLMFASGGVQPTSVFEQTDLTAIPTQATPAPSKTLDAPAAPLSVAQTTPAALTQAELDSAVASALERWITTGLTSEQIERLKSLSFEISSLPGLHLGEAGANVIRISSHAGGNGWFMDASTASDALFSTVSAETRRYTEPTSAPAGRIDLLTTVMHEMGHALGLSDSYNLRDRNSIMYGHLTTGERRYPSKDQARGAAPFKGDSTHFLTGAVNIGALPPGKSVTITYDVIVNNPATTATLSSQATVSGGNFANVLSDDLVTLGDPLLPGAADPTVTLIELPDVSVTVAPATTAEDGAGNLVYTFTRTGATTGAMTVNFAATGTASATTDYSVTSGTGVVNFTPGTGLGSIEIPIGSSTATAIVDPSVDATVEPDETVIVGITSGFYDIVAPVSATGTITTDDTAVSIDALPDVSLFEDQSLNFSYTFRRTGLTTGTTVANFTVGGSAVANTDYTPSGATTFTTTSGTVTFAPGAITVVVTLDPTNDNLVEGNETIALTVTSGSGYSPAAPTSQTATIVDDDVNVSLTSVVPNTSVEDGGIGMDYTFTRSGGSVSNALTVNIGVSGTAVFDAVPANSDYSQSGAASFTAATGTITFAGGVTTKTVTITPIADVTNEPDETVILTVAANGAPAVTGGYSVGGTPSGTGTILNDDTQVSVAVAPTPVGEASGTGMVYAFTRTGSTAAAQLVNFTKSGTASIATSDFSAASSDVGMNYAAGTVTIPIGSSTVTITLTPLEDALVEGSETAILTVAAGSGYAPSGSPATGTITDNDTATIGYVTTTSTVGEATANDVQQLVLTLTTTGAGTPTLAYPVSVNVTGPSGTATSGTDYTPPTAVTFAANSLDAAQVPASIAITNDRAVEGTETAGLGLAINTDGTGGAVTIAVGAAATHTTTITDNDTATVSYSAANSSVGEGAGNDSIGLTLTVTGNGTGPLVLERSASFDITATGGTATGSGTDYTLPGAVTIPAATLDAAVTSFNLAIANDQLVEGSETAILGLTLNTDNTGGQVAVGAGNAHTTTITDNDTATVTFAAPTSNVAENAGPDVMNLVLTIVGNGVGTAQITSAVSVNVTDAGGGTAAGAGVDFTLPTLVTFPANSLSASTQPASLGITDDAIVETNETVNLGLAINSDPSGAVSIGAANTHVTTILDNDTATISFSKIIDGSEGPPIVNGKFRITQTAQASTNTVVNYTVSGSAVPGPGNDYATLSGTATILAGNTFVDVDVIVQADVGSEPPETVIITFSSFGLHDADITLGAPSSATLSILSGSIITGTWMGPPLITTAGSFDCTGLTLDIDLGFLPVNGTPYTLVHADGGVTGNFNDLPQNGVIALSFNGVIYYFQANYTATDVILTPFPPSGPAEWKWVSGPSSRNGVGVYGTLGTAAPTNNPGARQGAMNWYSPDGSLWMMGGYGYATAVTNPPRYLNDVWQYNRVLGQWVWRAGANTFNSPGTYGTLGVEAPGNTPGARHTGTTWTDADGDLWLFGGYGIGASGAPAWLNDLWRFDRSSGRWTHMKGSTATGGAATYGVQGTLAAGNTPGARSSATGFFRDGNLWLFGGYNGTAYYNDLWRYEIATGNWAWMEGSNTPNVNGTYGTQGTPNAANTPGSRRDATGWTANDGTLWLFGGLGLPASGATAGDMSDLWRYNPTTGDWTWIKGVDTLNATGVYGTQGTPAPGNLPAARSAGSGWVTVDGDLWLVGGFKNSYLGYDDVWIYDIGTNQWTWKLGSQGLLSQQGVYGTKGTAAPANKPGGRFTPSTWVTLNGSLWIFGGGGADSFGNTGRLSDLWQYAIPKPLNTPYEDVMPDDFPNDLIVNSDPNATDATAGTMAYVPVSGQLTGTDPDGDRLLFGSAGATTNSQGTLTLNKDGTWTYTPTYGFTGVASFQFKAADNYGGESSVKTLVISVVTNPADSDGDGIADAYEQSIWGNLAAADGDGDADLDGQSNYFEFLAGTNPLNGNETLATAPTVTGTTSANGHVQLQLNHVRPGVNYHLETSTDLDAWSRVGTFTFSVSGSATVEDPTPATSAPKFYRMSLEATPAVIVP